MERNERLKAAEKCASRYTNENESRIARKAFMEGCEFESQGEAIKGVVLQAEEDLALTWRDIAQLSEILDDLTRDSFTGPKLYYEKVLRRFNEYKEGKE
jgi:hypothetical protein